MNHTISYIIPSVNRASLKATIDSIELWPGDEVLVEFDILREDRYGNAHRNAGIARAKCDYLAFIDDDDWYVRGHRQIMENAINENPGKPNLFKIEYPDGNILWKEKNIVPGNVSTQMFLVPNIKERLGKFKVGRNMGDYYFAASWKWDKDDIIWREEIISNLSHNDGSKNIL